MNWNCGNNLFSLYLPTNCRHKKMLDSLTIPLVNMTFFDSTVKREAMVNVCPLAVKFVPFICRTSCIYDKLYDVSCTKDLIFDHRASCTSYYSQIVFDERVISTCFNAYSHCLVCVRLHNGYTWFYTQIKQHTHMHMAVTGRFETKKLLSRRRWSHYSGW